MAPLLIHLWDNGVQTLFSCQGNTFDDPVGDLNPHIEERFKETGEVQVPYPGWTNGYILMSDGYDYVAHRVRHLLWTEGTSRGPSTFLSEDAYRNGGQLWLESDYHQWGKMPYPSESLSLHWRGRPDYENLRHIYDAFGLDFPEARKNPMAPGYQSYGWTTQDWRSIKVNNKGDIDYSEKCGAEGTKTPSGSPRLCLPAAVVKSLIRTESGKDVIRTQARKKARAKKGERVPWHPRIKKIWKRIEDKTVKDRPNPSEADFFPGDAHSFSPYATAQTIPITALQNPPVDKVWVRNAKRQAWTEEGTLDFMGLESAPYESFTYRYYIYEAENKLAFAEITHTPEERKVSLDLIGVADDARGKKYGEALLARIKDDYPGHTITLLRSSRPAIKGVEKILGRRATPVPDDVLKGWYQRNGFRALMSEVGKPVWGTSEQGRRKIIGRGEERESARMVAINPPEWRHGEFSEEDPFEEYF